MRKKSPLEIAGIVIFGGAAIVGLAILFGFVIMWLWNWIMPELFDLPALTYWQAVGLFILSKIFIGGCGGRGGSKKSSKNECKDDKQNSKSDFSKWSQYDKFWEEEGDEMYKNYIDRKEGSGYNNPKNDITSNDSVE